MPGVWSTQGAEGTSSSIPGTQSMCHVCHVLHSQVALALPSALMAHAVCSVPRCALCLWCTQSRIHFPVTVSDFPFTFQTQSVHHISTSHQGAGAVLGLGPSLFAQQPEEGRQGALTIYAISGAMALRLRF